jgi:tRNA(fMet)-specific endonuclease VapC
MVIWALDSEAVSHAMRGEGRVAERLARVGPAAVAMPSMVVYEVNFGLRKAGLRTRLEAFAAWVRSVKVLDLDVEAADHAASIRVQLESIGKPIGPIDMLIAATARRHGCTLVTHNTRTFARVPDLRTEDWY